VLRTLSSRRGQWAIIEIVVVVAIIVVAAYFILPSYLSGAGKGKNGPDRVHTPIGQAESVDCRNNLNQIRNAIEMEKTSGEEGRVPASLADLGPSMSAVTKCAISGKEYTYDPSTARVSCITPGHEGY
jgi:hypothetical protein